MIDLHNHILPGVDDGPQTLGEALEMARLAVRQGTTIMAATPHRYHGRSEQTASVVIAAVGALQAELDARGIALKLVPGVEATMRPDTSTMIRTGVLLPLGGPAGTHLLIEPPFDRIPPHAISLLQEIVELGLTPVLAHPERNSEVQRHPAFLETCAGAGAAIQLTAGSIVGKFGEAPRECARLIALRRDWTIIIASDAHDAYDRTPADIPEAVDTVAGWISDFDEAHAMATTVPASFLT